jgi:drug/metabolite transporter (DMT)-like permease
MLRTLSSHQLGIVLVTSGSLLVSLDALGIRLTEEDPWTIAFWLGSFMAIAMFVLVRVRTGSSLPAVAKLNGWPILVSGLLQAASTSFFVLAITSTTVADAVAIVAATPMVAALIAHFAIKERTSMRTWLGIVAAVGGVLVVVSGSLGGGEVKGDLYAVAAITAFSINITMWQQLPAMNRQVVVGLGGLALALISFAPADPFDISGEAIAILAVLGLLTGPAGRVSTATSTRHLPASKVGLFVPIETIAATAWAWLFLSETPKTITLIGGVIVIAAVVFGMTKETKSIAFAGAPL